jgi:sugar (pentulose or hexulose) kinase
MLADLTAVLDIGRANARLSLIDVESGETTWSLQRRCTMTAGSPIRSLDVPTIGSLVLAALAAAPGKERIRAIVPVAHGAAAVWLSATGEVLAAPDCEDPVFGEVGEAYRQLRDPFEDTFSPFLPLGLNLGRQIYYLQQTHPELYRACDAIMLYPQYWAWRLCGVKASEITSLGCHTDLWKPREAVFSDLARSQGWDALLPPVRAAGDELGAISPAIARITGLDPTCRVICGIHDSNASYLCHRGRHQTGERFAVVSSGTCTLVMAHGAELDRLREARDMLANIDAFGAPVATARFMGGREYDSIAGDSRTRQQPSLESLLSVLKKHAVALPSFASSGGPFGGHEGRLVNADGLDNQERAALATLYCALETDLLLDLLDTSCPVVVEGPLATNPLYGRLLATVRPNSDVSLGDYRGGSTTECARFLLGHAAASQLRKAAPLDLPHLDVYRTEWRADATAKLPSEDQPHWPPSDWKALTRSAP